MEQKLLIKRAQKGDTAAFARLYEQVYKKMYQYAIYTLRSEEDAADAVSETVMEAFERISQLRSEDAFNTWIFRILSNKCRALMRNYYEPKVSIDSLDTDEGNVKESIEGQSMASPDISDNIQLSIDLRLGMRLLDEDERQIISMHVILGYKSKQIAEYLGMNENTVRSKESRGLAKLKEYMTE